MEVPQSPRSILETMLKEVAESWKWFCGVDQFRFKTFPDPKQKQIWRANLRVVLNLTWEFKHKIFDSKSEISVFSESTKPWGPK